MFQIRFLADPVGDFTYKQDLAFESAGIFGQNRSKRYAMKTEDGKITELYIEPDNTSVKGKYTEVGNVSFVALVTMLIGANSLCRRQGSGLVHARDTHRLYNKLECHRGTQADGVNRLTQFQENCK